MEYMLRRLDFKAQERRYVVVVDDDDGDESLS